MGVVNVTPDSFSDGGLHLDADKAVETAFRLTDEGADLIDIGAESTRPGSLPVEVGDEWRRLEPVLERLAKRTLGARLSVDTRKSEIMLRAADRGVRFINDSSGTADGRRPLDPANAGPDDDALRALAARADLDYCAMHMHGTPKTMQLDPLRGPEAVRAVDRFFAATRARFAQAGFGASRLWLDPGIGFGKGDAANLALLAAIPRWAAAGQVAVGVSRKGFIGRALGIEAPEERDGPTKMLELGLGIAGARLIRTHDVRRLARLRTLLAGGG